MIEPTNNSVNKGSASQFPFSTIPMENLFDASPPLGFLLGRK